MRRIKNYRDKIKAYLNKPDSIIEPKTGADALRSTVGKGDPIANNDATFIKPAIENIKAEAAKIIKKIQVHKEILHQESNLPSEIIYIINGFNIKSYVQDLVDEEIDNTTIVSGGVLGVICVSNCTNSDFQIYCAHDYFSEVIGLTGSTGYEDIFYSECLEQL